MSAPSPIRAAAAAQGLTLVEVAKACGVTTGSLGQVSRGNVKPWPKLRRNLTELFGRDVFADTDSVDDDTRARFVAERAAQGFGPTVTDPVVLAAVAAILRTAAANTERPAT